MVRVEDRLFRYFDKQGDLDGVELKKRTLILTMSVMAALVQLALVFAYNALDRPPMVVITMLGATFSILCYVLANNHKYDIAGIMLTIGIFLVVVADDYFVGTSNNSLLYLFTLLVITLLIPYRHKAISFLLCTLLPLLMAGLYIFGLYHTPQDDLGAIMRVFATVNILVTSGSVILIIGISRMIGRYVDDYSRKRMEALEVQSYRDALTQMYNRHYADLHFSRLAAENPPRSVCVAIVDLDDFKKVNDTYGHDAGDTTLREISRLMRESLRQTDLVIRWGGEEFVLILHDILPEGAHGVLDKVRHRVSEHTIVHNEYRFQVTATIGLAALDMRDLNASLEDCDRKLYEGKRTSKNVVIS